MYMYIEAPFSFVLSTSRRVHREVRHCFLSCTCKILKFVSFEVLQALQCSGIDGLKKYIVTFIYGCRAKGDRERGGGGWLRVVDSL